MDQKKLHILSLLAALTAATIFGMSFMFSKMALATAAPTVLLAFRFTVAVAAMSLVIALNALVGKVRGKPLFAFSLKGKPVGKLLLLGIVQPVAYFIFENYGILYTCLFESAVQFMLDIFPDCITCRFDCHASFYTCVAAQFRFFDNVCIPLCKIVFHGSDRFN